jgi:hypothetical protein
MDLCIFWYWVLFLNWSIEFNPLNNELNPICHLLALLGGATIVVVSRLRVNPLNAELNPICHMLALLGGATIVVVSRLRVNCEPCLTSVPPFETFMFYTKYEVLHKLSPFTVSMNAVYVILQDSYVMNFRCLVTR